MINSSLEAYSSVRKLAAVQNVAGGQNTLTGSAELEPVDKEDHKLAVEVDKTVLTAAVKKLNELVSPALQTIEFSIDQESDRLIVKVVDSTTHKVLRQVPNEEVVAFSKTLDRLQGLVIRQSV